MLVEMCFKMEYIPKRLNLFCLMCPNVIVLFIHVLGRHSYFNTVFFFFYMCCVCVR